MGQIVVVGGTLPGLAAAARLAKAGHTVTLVERRGHLGGRLASPGVWAPLFVFPAPLRDLFRKSGRAFDPEFGRRGLRLVTAPPAVHTFPDGTELPWPADRGAQWHLLSTRFSPGLAIHWRDTLDDYDDTWQTLRRLGLEAELADPGQVHARKAQLRPRYTLAALAEHLREPHLAAIVRDLAPLIGSDPRETPAWLATRLGVERTFGRWMLVDDDGIVQPATAILDALAERLATRGVRVLTGTAAASLDGRRVQTSAGTLEADAVVSALNPWSHAALTGVAAERRAARRLERALAPTVTVTHHSRARTDDDQPPASETVRHTPAGPIVTYTRTLAQTTEVVVHDYTRPLPDQGLGVRWRGSRTWLRLPALRTPTPRLFSASTAARGGNEPWAQLLTGALATYAVHETLTGENIRPSNRDYRP